MKLLSHILLITFLSAFPVFISAQENRVVVFDGIKKYSHWPDSLTMYAEYAQSQNMQPGKKLKEHEIAVKHALKNKAKILAAGREMISAVRKDVKDLRCKQFEKAQIPLVKTEGSFTRPGAKQTAYLYRLFFCDNDVPKEEFADYITGIVVFENGKAVTNRVYADFGGDYRFHRIYAVPDINQNGLSEIAVDRGWAHFELIEFDGDGMKSHGQARVYDRNGGLDRIPYTFIVSTVTAIPGKEPRFFIEEQFKRGGDEWKVSKPLAEFKLEPLPDDYTPQVYRTINP